MRRIFSYIIEILCVFLFVLAFFTFFDIKIEISNFSVKTNNLNENKYLDSALIGSNIDNIIDIDIKNNDISSKVVSSGQEEGLLEVSEEVKKDKHYSEPPIIKIIDTSNYEAISSEIINMSHYGHDCSGAACSLGLTASGYFIGDGRHYYNDPTFGSVRIVAADKKYPLGTIVRIGYREGTTITAIVLDRGGGIGDHGKFQIDLLTPSEEVANKLGVVRNTKLEVLRLGYNS